MSFVSWVGKTRFLRFGFIGSKVLFKNLITAEVQKLGFFKEFYLLSPKFDNNTRDKKNNAKTRSQYWLSDGFE